MKIRFITKALLAICVATPTFAAQHSSTPQLTNLALEADLVFKGQVVNIDHKSAKSTPSGQALPYTFVTYAITEVLHGNYQDKEITLRFLGGEMPDGRILLSSDAPFMNVSDRDILFVKDNGNAECPLVACATGRLRIVEDQLYSNEGQPILEDEQGNLTYGESVDREEFNTFSIGQKQYQKNRKKEVSTSEIDPSRLDSQEQLHPLSISRMQTALQQELNQSKDPFGKNKTVHSVNKMDATMPAKAAPETLPEPRSIQPKKDRATQSEEENRLQKNNQNPVLDMQ